MTVKEAFEEVITTVAAKLRPQGFVRRRLALKKVIGESAVIVEFQKSDRSSSSQIIFTINLGVVCGELLDSGIAGLKKAQAIDAHVSDRLGFFLHDPIDTWWEVNESTDRDSLSNGLCDVLLTEAIPYLESYVDRNALIALWESGKAPGLTAGQRARYLARLKKDRA